MVGCSDERQVPADSGKFGGKFAASSARCENSGNLRQVFWGHLAMKRNFEGKVALITGGSMGIGRACAYGFAAEGAKVAVTSRNLPELEATAAKVRQLGSLTFVKKSDFLDRAQVASIAPAVLAEFGRIDILVNNAAIIHPRIDLIDLDDETWYDVMEVNLNAAAMLTKSVVPAMVAQGGGSIINISSIGGRSGARGRSAYRVTKSALISLTQSLAAELHEHGINVNAICPGGTDTEGYRAAFNNRGREDFPNLMLPEEIANVAVFLASESSSAITGTAIDAFGGNNPLFS